MRALAVDDDPVHIWKVAWQVGARARWSGATAPANPYDPGSPRAEAWAAGWRWGGHQPDRRTNAARLAHSHRRSGDGTSFMRSATKAGVGVSTLVVAGWLWHMRRKRRVGDRTE